MNRPQSLSRSTRFLNGTLLGISLNLGCVTVPAGPNRDAAGEPISTVQLGFLRVDNIDLNQYLPANPVAPRPTVLMFHSAMGRIDSVLRYADALAQTGFAVCVLDFYDGRVAANVEEARALRDEANRRSERLATLVTAAQASLRYDTPNPIALTEIRNIIVARRGAATVVLVDGDHGFMESNHRGYNEPSAAPAWIAVNTFLNR